jgi:hypothetical protein
MNNGQGGIHAVASQPALDTAVVTAWRRSAIFARGMLHASLPTTSRGSRTRHAARLVDQVMAGG